MTAAEIVKMLDKNRDKAFREAQRKTIEQSLAQSAKAMADLFAPPGPGGARLSLTPSDLPKSEKTPGARPPVGPLGDIGHKMSAEAFERAQPKMSRTKRLILAALTANPNGLTRSELAATLAIPKDSCNGRVSELRKAGLVQCVRERDGEGIVERVKHGGER